MASIISKVLDFVSGNRRTYKVKRSDGKVYYDTYTVVKDGKEKPLFMGMGKPPKKPVM